MELKIIKEYEDKLKSRGNSRDYKVKLAFELVKFYYSKEGAQAVEEHFINTFSKKKVSENMAEIKPTNYDIVTVLSELGFSSTRSEARRVIEQGGVKVNEIIIDDSKKSVKKDDVIQKGKRFFVKIIK